MRYLILCAALVLPSFGHAASEKSTLIRNALSSHVITNFADFASRSTVLAQTARDNCTADDPTLRAAFGEAFDAWIRVSHLRFGPTETDNRAFGLAFWPDSRGKTPRALKTMITSEDPAAHDPKIYGTISIAARGFYALEFLLYDAEIKETGTANYRCAVIQANTRNIAEIANFILLDWDLSYADYMRHPNQGDSPYQSEDEAIQELYKAVLTGLEFTANSRLGRPLGSFERPRPNRAEARRSDRSLRHVLLSVDSSVALSRLLAIGHDDLKTRIDAAHDIVKSNAQSIDKLDFSNITTAENRLKVEILQQSIIALRDLLIEHLGPHLGVKAGFNALDGD
ncbi:MAG: imelysin family protein [Halocynthiibacter sp.]